MTEEAQPQEQNITRKAGRGIVWNFLTYGLSKGVVLLTTSILARLLTKEDFGLISVAIIAINYLAVVKDLGLGLALIQRRDHVEEAANTVFTINLILGITLSAAVFFFAPLFAAYFEDPAITPVLRWLGLSFAINSLGSVHVNLLVKDLAYRKKFIPDIGNTLVKGTVSIALAFAGQGVWALVFGQIAGALTATLLVWLILPWRPQLSLNLNLAKELIQYGASVTGYDVLSVFIDNLSNIVIGKVFGLAALSVFTMAYRLPEMLLIGNLWVLAAVLFPLFSSIQDRPDDLRKGFLISIRLVQIIAVPICLGLFLAADPIVRVLFGEQWLEVIPLLRILAIFALIYSVGYHAGDVYKALGRPDILLKLTVASLFIYIPALLLGAQFGLTGIVWGYLAAIVLEQIINLTVATRFVKVTLLDILREFKPSALSALAMVPTVSLTLFLTAQTNPFLQLTLVVLGGAAAYLGTLWLVEKDNLLQISRVLLSKK